MVTRKKTLVVGIVLALMAATGCSKHASPNSPQDAFQRVAVTNAKVAEATRVAIEAALQLNFSGVITPGETLVALDYLEHAAFASKQIAQIQSDGGLKWDNQAQQIREIVIDIPRTYPQLEDPRARTVLVAIQTVSNSLALILDEVKQQ